MRDQQRIDGVRGIQRWRDEAGWVIGEVRIERIARIQEQPVVAILDLDAVAADLPRRL